MSPTLVGRDRERSALLAAWDDTRSAAGVVLVGGEAGLGKTRLVRDFTSGLGASARVIEGGCTDLGPDGLPFGAFVTALRRLIRALGGPAIAAMVPGGGRRGLARLLPELGADDADPDRELGRARLFEEVLLLLEGSAERQPVVLVLEDLHWADRSTGDLLDFLARNLSRPGVLVLGTFRPDEIDAAHPLRPVLTRTEGVRQLALTGLTRDEVAEQVAALQPGSAAADRIFQRSEGNPLFVEALVAGGDETAGSLRDLLLADVERLPEPSRRIVRAAAVAAAPVHHRLLAGLVELDDLAVEAALRPLLRGRWLEVVDDGYAFRRDLIREAVQDALLPSERARLNRRCAEAVSADPRLVAGERAQAELARYWFAAGELGRAAAAAWQAADSARHAFAYAEEYRMRDRLLQLWDHRPDSLPADRSEVQRLAIEAALNAGELAAGFDLATAALADDTGQADTAAQGDDECAAHLLLLRAELGDRTGRDQLPDLLAARDRLPATPSIARGRVLAALATAQRHRRRLTAASESATEALTIGEATGEPAVQAAALTTLAALAALAGELPKAVELFDRAGRAAEAARADDLRLLVTVTESDALEAAGEHERAEQVARDGITVARELGLARTRGTLLAPNLAESLLSLGRYPESTEVYREAMALNPPPLYQAYLQVIQATVELRRGEFEAAESGARQARATLHEQTRGVESCLEPDLLDCRLAEVRGEVPAVELILRHVLDDHDLRESPRYGWPLILIGVRALADGPLLQRLRSVPLPSVGRLQTAHRLSVEAETDPDGWPAAIEAWRQVGQPYALAETLLRAAGSALTRQDRPAATGSLTEAAAIAGELGATPLRERALGLSRRGRLGLDDDRKRASPAGLTPRELEVLELVAAGHSNRQIGERLFISTKTAGVHVSNILGKLAVTTRLEAAAWAHRLGLFD